MPTKTVAKKTTAKKAAAKPRTGSSAKGDDGGSNVHTDDSGNKAGYDPKVDDEAAAASVVREDATPTPHVDTGAEIDPSIIAHNEARKNSARMRFGGLLGDAPLHPGANGAHVELVQALLRSRGYGVQIDGNAGGETQRALAKFRDTHGLDDDADNDDLWDALVNSDIEDAVDQGPHTVSPPSPIASQQPDLGLASLSLS